MHNKIVTDKYIDAVIPAHVKDVATLDHCIAGIRKNIKNIRRIIVVSKEKYTKRAEWFDEKLYPFSFAEISEILNHQNVGWNYQQLLKLYSVLIIPNISQQVLIIDADTVFYRSVEFVDEDGKALYNLSKDKNLYESKFHNEILVHIANIAPQIAVKIPELFGEDAKNNKERANQFIKKLNFRSDEDFKNANNLESGICHHMLFEKRVMESLFSTIESNFKGEEFYKVFLKNRQSLFGVAEYNLYFYFLISHFPDAYKIRILRYKNTSKFYPIIEKIRKKYDYCSYHSYMRGNSYDYTKIYKKLQNIYRKLFLFEQWNIGILNFNIAEIFNKEIDIKWLEEPRKSELHADPFTFEIDDKIYIIFEKYSLMSRRGRIFMAEYRDNKILQQKLLLDNKKHYSYPHVFNDNNKIYVTCESFKTNKLELFELDKKNLELIKIRDIFNNKTVIDPTIFKHHNKYFLFYSDLNQYLNIAYADSLHGEFYDHPKNPVKSDITSSRPAGNIFAIDDKIYRPAQNCSETYGGSIVINEIKILDTNDFVENKVLEIKPKSSYSFNQGIHTISSSNSKTSPIILIDGKRSYYLATKPLITIMRKLKEIAC